MAPHRGRVVSSSRDLDDTVTLTVDIPDGAMAQPVPGQFHMLWAPGIGEVPISVSGTDGPDRLVFTIRAVGAVTAALCATGTGDEIGVRGPYGTDWALDSATGHDVIIVAGGIGLAPVRPAVRAVISERDSFRRVAVLIGARRPNDLLYQHEIEEWRSRSDLDVRITVDVADPGWCDDVGVVPSLVPRADVDFSDTFALVCGPEVMIRFTADALVAQGVSPERVRVSLERNMQCAVGHCGHCQFGANFVCRDGPVFGYDDVSSLMRVREL